MHYAWFPFWVAASTLPWSLLLLGFWSREVRTEHRDHMRFLWGAIAITFPTVWLLPGTVPRFFMPLYPLLAVLVGTVVEHCLAQESRVRSSGTLFARGFAVVMAVTAVGLPVAKAVTEMKLAAAQSWTFAIAYALGVLALAVAMWCYARRAHVVVACGAVFVGAAFSGLYTNYKVHTSERIDVTVAELKARLPADVNLVSFGPVHHVFRYHYRRPVRMLPLASFPDAAARGIEYFCVQQGRTVEGAAYEEIARINCYRKRESPPREYVRVCRFLR